MSVSDKKLTEWQKLANGILERDVYDPRAEDLAEKLETHVHIIGQTNNNKRVASAIGLAAAGIGFGFNLYGNVSGMSHIHLNMAYGAIAALCILSNVFNQHKANQAIHAAQNNAQMLKKTLDYSA